MRMLDATELYTSRLKWYILLGIFSHNKKKAQHPWCNLESLYPCTQASPETAITSQRTTIIHLYYFFICVVFCCFQNNLKGMIAKLGEKR
jgi:hypothetical protein